MILEGTVDNIIFRNDDNGYTVLLLNTSKAVFTIVGNIEHIEKGENLKVDVSEYNNEIYGKQYKINSYEIVMPTDEEAIKKYLTTSEFKGVGKATVKRIVEMFGKDTINIILNNSDKLYGIKGINDNKIRILKDKLTERQNELEIVFALEKYKLGPKLIRNIIDTYGSETLKIVKENPYKMAMEVDGIGFVICDNIAKINGYQNDDQKRVEAGIVYLLEESHMQGNVFEYKEKIIIDAKKLLSLVENYDFSDVFYNLEVTLKIKTFIYNDKEIVFLKSVYNVEQKLSNMLYENKDSIHIITGGPGTGKTYTIKQYLNDALDNGLKVELCAPTGRAAKRIEEVTGHSAKTIHRLLECVGQGDGKKSYFNRNDENPLDCDILIVDEMSMVDEYLLLSLMKAVPRLCEIIFVGDVDQLPSVGAGQVLKDMIEANIFDVTYLTEIHRQDEGSNIVINAHLVNNGEDVDLSTNTDDFKFIHKSSEEKINEAITILAKDKIPNYFNISNEQIQILCPSKKGTCGTILLNKILQVAINPEDYTKNEISVGETIFREGDKIMQTINNYNIPYDIIDKDGFVCDRGMGIFNGDIGIIQEINSDNKTIEAKFDDRIAYYGSKDLKDLSLAYAITVHKSQGSEYDVVVMPMAYAPYKLQNRKILYTAMTRAKKCICFVGGEKFFHNMKNNINMEERNSALCSKMYLGI